MHTHLTELGSVIADLTIWVHTCLLIVVGNHTGAFFT
jgi:hypothetical protein